MASIDRQKNRLAAIEKKKRQQIKLVALLGVVFLVVVAFQWRSMVSDDAAGLSIDTAAIVTNQDVPVKVSLTGPNQSLAESSGAFQNESGSQEPSGSQRELKSTALDRGLAILARSTRSPEPLDLAAALRTPLFTPAVEAPVIADLSNDEPVPEEIRAVYGGSGEHHALVDDSIVKHGQRIGGGKRVLRISRQGIHVSK